MHRYLRIRRQLQVWLINQSKHLNIELNNSTFTTCHAYVHAEAQYLRCGECWRVAVDSYPTNSSSRDTSSSGGMLNTDWGRFSFFCLFITTGPGGETTTAAENTEGGHLLIGTNFKNKQKSSLHQ